MNKNNKSFLNGLVVVTFVGMVIVNALANILPINGLSTGEVSDSYPNLFAPAGLTFSIWGVIYLLLFLHTLYQIGLLRGKDKQVNDALLQKTAVAFSMSSIVNSLWIFAWHYKAIPVSMILMVCLLVCLIYIAMITHSQKLSLRENVLVRIPFSVYFGWITVATIANATTLLVSIGWNGFGLKESTWTIIMLVIGVLIGILTSIRLKNIAYHLVLIWAYIGILIKHTSEKGFSKQYPIVILVIIICIVVYTVSLIYNIIGKRKKFG